MGRSANFEGAKLHRARCAGARLDRSIFTKADCREAVFSAARIPYGDFSHAVLRGADFSRADLLQCVLHRIDDEGTDWTGTNKKLVKATDRDLAEAEDWTPPAV